MNIDCLYGYLLVLYCLTLINYVKCENQCSLDNKTPNSFEEKLLNKLNEAKGKKLVFILISGLIFDKL